jgi:hypothetical protein
MYAQISYTENFENGMGIWSGSYFTSSIMPCEGIMSVRDNIYNPSGGHLTSGLIGTSNGGTIALDFKYKVIDYYGNLPTHSTFGVTEVQYAASASGPWQTIYTINASNHNVSSSCNTINANFTPSPGDLYMRFVTTYNTGDYYFYIDDINLIQGAVSSCPQPLNVSASNITSNGVDILWTSGGAANWNVEYGPVGFMPGSGTKAFNVPNPFSLTMLNPNTNYDIYVQDSCGVGDVSASTVISVTTQPSMHPFPLLEDFEDSVLFFESDENSNTDWILTDTLAHSGNHSVQNIYHSNENNILHETGILDLSMAGAPVLEFWHIANTEQFDQCRVQISIDGGVTYNNLLSSEYRSAGAYFGYFANLSYTQWSTDGGSPDNSWWKKEVFDLRNYSVSNVRIRFVVDADGYSQHNGNGWYIDDIKIYEPSCPTPFDFVNTYSSMDSVIISWTAGNQETMWNIEYGEIGFVQGTGTVVSSNDIQDTIVNLNLGAVYEFYVQADCGSGDVSDWMGPHIVATEALNDLTCDAIFVSPNTDFSTRIFSNIGTSLQAGESNLPGEQYNTVWFKTVIPASGHLLIETCNSDFNSIVGVFANDTLICDSMETFHRIGYAGAYSPSTYSVCGASGNGAVVICGATPGDTVMFYVGGTSYSESGIIHLVVSDYSFDGYAGEGPDEPLSVCAGDTINLREQLSNQQSNNGYWEYPSNPFVIVNDTTANTGALSLIGDEIYYVVANLCDADTATVVINAVTAANSGEALSNFVACSNGDVFLFNGLTGTIDAGGTWEDDTNTGLLSSDSKFIADGLPDGPYQFTYTVDNSVCPPSSTQVTVNLVDCTTISENGPTIFNVYPNPNKGTFIITNNEKENSVVMEVIDIQGKVLYTDTFMMEAGGQQQVSLENIDLGIYLIRLMTDNQMFNVNVIIE